MHGPEHWIGFVVASVVLGSIADTAWILFAEIRRLVPGSGRSESG